MSRSARYDPEENILDETVRFLLSISSNLLRVGRASRSISVSEDGTLHIGLGPVGKERRLHIYFTPTIQAKYDAVEVFKEAHNAINLLCNEDEMLVSWISKERHNFAKEYIALSFEELMNYAYYGGFSARYEWRRGLGAQFKYIWYKYNRGKTWVEI